ncbi:MAG: cell division protein FtsB [Legionellaceae bacterium]|nr:cell division protein FtsB [Legionellaceae bacterium]
MRSVMILLLVLLAGLQYKLWLADNSIWQWFHLHQHIAQQKEKNQQLLQINEGIAADIEELRRGEQALEERARHELGMVRAGETYYQFIE